MSESRVVMFEVVSLVVGMAWKTSKCQETIPPSDRECSPRGLEQPSLSFNFAI